METLGTVLLVDDDQPALTSEQARLERLGYNTATATDASGALPLLAAQDGRCGFDVAIVELEVPGDADLALVRYMRQHCPRLPVIATTRRPRVETASAAVGLGVQAYLVRPYPSTELEAALTEAMAVTHLQRALLSHRNLLDECRAKVSQASALLVRKASTAAAQDAFIEVALWHVVSAVSELCQFVAAAPPGAEGQAAADSAVGGVSLGEVVGALHQTVGALDRTRSVFKSKELGQLRLHIEGLLARLSQDSHVSSG